MSVKENDKNNNNNGIIFHAEDLRFATPSSTNVHEQCSRETREPIVYFRRRKGPKRKRLDQVIVDSVATTLKQDEELSPLQDNEKTPNNDFDSNTIDIDMVALQRKDKALARRQPPPPLPKREILEYIIDKLQERDTGNLFAHPVDSIQVEGYYHIIKNPMDFGTLRKNLVDGLYRSLDQFEHDVLAIFKNAMEYNSKCFVYFRQARHIHELAKSYFRKLRADSSKIIEEFQQRANKTSTRPRRTRNRRGSSRSQYYGEMELPDSAYERRQSWKPLMFERDEEYASIFSRNEERQLTPENSVISYKQSLNLFTKDLGPTAKYVARNKLSLLDSTQSFSHLAAIHNEPTNRRILNSVAQRTSHIQMVDYTNPFKNSRGGLTMTNLAAQPTMGANLLLSQYHKCQSDLRGKQIISDQHAMDLNKQYGKRQTNYLPSDARPGLFKFWSRNNSRSQAKAFVHPSKVIKPSRLGNCNPFQLTSSSSPQTSSLEKPLDNARFDMENQNPSVSPPFSYMEFLMNEDDQLADEIALREVIGHSSSPVTEPHYKLDISCEPPSASLPVSQNASLSYMQLLMGEGDVSRHEAALIEEMSHLSTFEHGQSSSTNFVGGLI